MHTWSHFAWSVLFKSLCLKKYLTGLGTVYVALEFGILVFQEKAFGRRVGLSSKANSFASMKVLSCVFFDDVLCSYRKNVKLGVMGRCFKCRYYKRFKRESDKEEEEFFEEVERIRRGEPR